MSMVVLRFAPLERSVDLVTLIGGGQLLLASALFTIALVALFLRIMDHPKWRISMIGITTTLVIILFAMQFISVRRWHEAGQRVAVFQAQAQEAAVDAPIGVLPDYRDYYGAPMNLSDSIAHESIFSTAIPAVSILPLRADRAEHRVDTMTVWSQVGGELKISGDVPDPIAGLFPNPLAVSKSKNGIAVADLLSAPGIPLAKATIEVDNPTSGTVTITITARGEPLPKTVLPATLPKEQDSEP
jgi:hypothetical protein